MGRAHSHEIGRKTNQTMEAEEKKSCDHYLFPLTELPDDILGEVFLRLPSLDLLRSSVVVCKKWRDIIRSQSLWKEKCKRDHCYTDAMLVTISGDFKELYFKNPYRSNLVKNPCAKEGNIYEIIEVNSCRNDTFSVRKYWYFSIYMYSSTDNRSILFLVLRL